MYFSCAGSLRLLGFVPRGCGPSRNPAWGIIVLCHVQELLTHLVQFLGMKSCAGKKLRRYRRRCLVIFVEVHHQRKMKVDLIDSAPKSRSAKCCPEELY